MLRPAQNLAGAIALHHAVIDLGKDARIAAKIGVVTPLPQALVAHHPRAGAAQAGGCFVRRIRFANQLDSFLLLLYARDLCLLWFAEEGRIQNITNFASAGLA